MAPKNISNFKNQNEEIEYYVPEKGLDLDYYMNINKNSILNNNKAKRLRKQASKFSSVDSLPNVYLIHGDLTVEEMAMLYNHPKTL